jgi:HK97 family phage prohead protease
VSEQTYPPREGIRAYALGAVEYRAAEGDGAPTLFGHFARFNEWTEINSRYEGHFMERFAPGAFKKTLGEQRSKLRVLFQHGQDPEIGDKPIAAIEDVREDDEGAYYEARLFDGLPPLVVDGLRAGQYGASHRFRMMRETRDQRPEPSEFNPNGIEERTVTEARLFEFGPVTFPAYEGATAGVRSLTDDLVASLIRNNPDRLNEIREMLDQAVEIRAEEPDHAPSESDAEPEEAHLTDERRETTPPSKRHIYGQRRKEKPSWLLGPSRSTRRS